MRHDLAIRENIVLSLLDIGVVRRFVPLSPSKTGIQVYVDEEKLMFERKHNQLN